jgi:hypothetical protein
MPVNVSVSTFTAATVGNPAIPYTITAQGVVSGPVTATPTPIPTPVKPVVSLSDSPTAGKFNVSIAGIIPTYKYQIWSYEKIESTIFDGNTYDANNWKLVANYALGSTFTNYLTGTGTKEINDFASISGTYTIAVRVVNESGVFVEQLKDAFTDVAINNIKISKVLVDSNVSMDTTEVKEITSGATVAFDVIANITSGTTYTAVTNPITTTMTSGTNGSFIWNISALKPGKYTVTLSATLSGNTDTRTIEIDLYDSSVTYGEISNIVINPTAPPVVTQPVVTQPVVTQPVVTQPVVTQPVVTQPVVTQPVVTQPVARVDTEIVPEIVNATGKTFQYTISEPGRAPYKSPDPFAATVTQISDISLLATEYGIYNLSAVIKNADGVVEDRYITSITNKRPGANSEVTFIEPPTTITKGTQRLISASATIPGVTSNSIEYSFWRYDARGWVMVRDYSTDSTLSWTPARVGEYSIQARAKGPGAKSYEAASSIEVSVTDTTDFKADVSNVTISTIGSSARRPVTITATATSTSEVLMYKFIITTPNSFFTKETSYSLSPKLTFIAGKAGEYTVRVLVKNDVSYGKYDYITDPALPMFKLTIN